MDFKRLRNNIHWILFFIVLLIFVVLYIRSTVHEKMIDDNGGFVIGQLVEFEDGDAKNSPSGIISYVVNDVKYEKKYFNKIRKNDVGKYYCVNYAKKSPDICRVLELNKCP
jgi:hypothetical protein